ncbi:MAG: hypothetical protein ACKVS6_08420 [Planctomycetota bacterium]
MSGSRLSKLFLIALCALGPFVFLIKAAVSPEGDAFPIPSAIPAVPVMIITIDGVVASDLAGPRTAEPMPHLAALIRDSTHFASTMAASPGGSVFLASIATGSLPLDHHVTKTGETLKPGFPTLATELKRQAREKSLEMPAFVFSNSKLFSDANLQIGFDTIVEKPGAKAADLAAEFQQKLGEHLPPRFFVWFDFRDLSNQPSDRKAALSAIDEGIGSIISVLHKHGIQGDGVLMLATDPGAGSPDAVPRGIVTIQLPYEYRSGVQCPVSISTIDLAPTALEILRLGVPPSWRGRSRKIDVSRFVPTGPALGGPCEWPQGSAWIAEQDAQTLIAVPGGSIVKFTDRANPRNSTPSPALLQAIAGLQNAKK